MDDTDVHTGLRWLAGAREAECFMYGMCPDKWYKAKTAVIKALVEEYHHEMFIFEERLGDEAFLRNIERGFAARTDFTLRGCVGALDGLLVYIKKPTQKETNKAISAFPSSSSSLNI